MPKSCQGRTHPSGPTIGGDERNQQKPQGSRPRRAGRDPVTEIALLVLAFVLILGCGVFVAAEFSLVTVDRPAVERAAQSGDPGAKRVLAALGRLSTHLSAAQLGITATSLLVGYLAEPSLAALLSPPLHSLGLPDKAAHAVAFAIALVVATYVSMLLGELVPKNLAIALPLRTAALVAGPQRLFTTVTKPAVTGLNAVANWLLRRVGVEPQEELRSARRPAELSSLVRRAADEGGLPPEQADLVDRALRFAGKRTEDVMTPRTRVHGLEVDRTADDLLAEARRSGFSRFPVWRDRLDDVAGLAQVRRAIGVARDRRGEVTLDQIMDEPLVVPATAPLDDLLAQLRSHGVQTAIVVDEFGGFAGIATMEDLVEELVGEVADEHDPRTARAHRRDDGSWLVSGLLRPDEVREVTGVPVPDGEYDTVAGFVLAELNRLPEQGDEVTADGWRLVVERMDGFRIAHVGLRQVEPEEPDTDGRGGTP
jgi:CBS domain containing-hemolysin-like protein